MVEPVPPPLISVVVPCYNEEGNVEILYDRLCAVFDGIKDVGFQVVFVDNASIDGTQDRLRALAARDPRVKVIFNIRNFGVLRSGLNGFFSSTGDAVICMACDMQDPPELIPEPIAQTALIA